MIKQYLDDLIDSMFGKKSVRERLKEIRNFAIFTFVFFIGVLLVVFSLSDRLITFLLQYYNLTAVTLTPLEYISTQLRISTFIAIVFAIPLISLSIFHYVRDLFSYKSQSTLKRYILFIFILGIAGLLFGIGYFTKTILVYLFSLPQDIQALWSLKSIFDFAIFSGISFALIFQTIILIPFLDKSGILEVSLLKKWRGVVLFIMIVLAAWITPTVDVISQLLFVIPFYGCFELGILFASIKKEVR